MAASFCRSSALVASSRMGRYREIQGDIGRYREI